MMKNIYVKKSKLRGKVSLPSSKSLSMRAIFFAAMACGESIIHNVLCSPDIEAALQAVKLLGARIERFGNSLQIQGVAGKTDCAGVLNVANSGIVLRFMSALSALSKNTTKIHGDASANARPMKELIKALEQRGVHCKSSNGFAPLEIQGPMKPGFVKLSGHDSQPVSALLMAMVFLEADSEIYVENPGEIPWVRMTLDWFKRLELKVDVSKTSDDVLHFYVKGSQNVKAFEYTVPGDWSSAAFLLQAAVCSQSEICIENIDLSALQGDKKLLDHLQRMGLSYQLDASKKELLVDGSKALKGASIDINDCIDSVATLAVLACFAEGTTEIHNAAVARQKECDRLACLDLELKKMGANISQREDGLVIHSSSLRPARVFSHHDHRLAMALCVAGLGIEGTSLVEETQCCNKSFPNFFNCLKGLGADLHGK